jgi:tetratricopeptide (TPR) repeat protein
LSIEFTFKSSIMKNRQTAILYILLCCACLSSCQRDNTAKLLELAEAQIWEKPDSTLQILEQISSPEKLKGKEQADYALLLTQAKYRCNILAPSDSLINIAINYYKEKEDADRKGAAYLYKGSVLNELHESEKAIQAYKQAEECIPKMTDTHLIARIYSDLGYLNQMELNYDIAKTYYKKSLSINKAEKYLSNSANDLINLMGIYISSDYQNKQDSAEWCTSELLNIVSKVGSNIQAKIFHNIAVQKMYKEKYTEAEIFLQKLKEVSNGKLSYKALSVWGELYIKMGHKEKADSLLYAALGTSDLTVKVNIYSTLYKQAEEDKQYKKAVGYLKKYTAVIDSVRDELKSTEIRELQLKYDKSITLRQNAEIRMNWYLTIAIGFLIVIALISLYFYSLKIYRKQKGKELSQQKQGSIKLQERIDVLQTMVEESENLHSLEREEALNKITALQNEKREKDIRIKQLETMFRAKDISISSADAEALQTFLKITELKKYIPAADRDKLQHWLNIVHQNFATRLNEQYSSLTGREKDICYLTALNLSLETVAQLLDVQPRSIERYTIRICEKFDFRKRSKESFIDFIIAFTHNQ